MITYDEKKILTPLRVMARTRHLSKASKNDRYLQLNVENRQTKNNKKNKSK